MTLIFGEFVAKFNAFQSKESSPEAFRSDVANFVCVLIPSAKPGSRIDYQEFVVYLPVCRQVLPHLHIFGIGSHLGECKILT